MSLQRVQLETFTNWIEYTYKTEKDRFDKYKNW